MKERAVIRQAILVAETLLDTLRDLEGELTEPFEVELDRARKEAAAAFPGTPIPPPLDADRLGRRLFDRRIGLGLTLERLAEQVGVSATTLARIEMGKREPTRATKARIETWLTLGPITPPGDRVNKRLTALERRMGLRGEEAV